MLAARPLRYEPKELPFRLEATQKASRRRRPPSSCVAASAIVTSRTKHHRGKTLHFGELVVGVLTSPITPYPFFGDGK